MKNGKASISFSENPSNMPARNCRWIARWNLLPECFFHITGDGSGAGLRHPAVLSPAFFGPVTPLPGKPVPWTASAAPRYLPLYPHGIISQKGDDGGLHHGKLVFPADALDARLMRFSNKTHETQKFCCLKHVYPFLLYFSFPVICFSIKLFFFELFIIFIIHIL